jgi:hypothetical protein
VTTRIISGSMKEKIFPDPRGVGDFSLMGLSRPRTNGSVRRFSYPGERFRRSGDRSASYLGTRGTVSITEIILLFSGFGDPPERSSASPLGHP